MHEILTKTIVVCILCMPISFGERPSFTTPDISKHIVINEQTVLRNDMDFSRSTVVEFIGEGCLLLNGFNVKLPERVINVDRHRIFAGEGNVVGPDTLRPEWWGAKGDFDETHGTGTDNRGAIRKTIQSAVLNNGAYVLFEKGKKYFSGDGYDDPVTGSQIQITGHSAKQVIVNGNGSTLYAGRRGGRTIVFSNAGNIVLENLQIKGSAGGPYHASRENDALIAITEKSKKIRLSGLVLSNCLGDDIYIGGSLQHAEGGVGYTSREITIENCRLKQRAGNLVPSLKGGTQGRNCISIIDATSVTVKKNIFYGRIDLEPNINEQRIQDVKITLNRFLDGPVERQAKADENLWRDEPISPKGKTFIPSVVMLNGKAGAPIIEGNVISDNFFKTGIIMGFRVYMWDSIMRNRFVTGLIRIGEDNVIGSATGSEVADNKADSVLEGQSSFILIGGQTAGNVFKNNILYQHGKYYAVAIGKAYKGIAFDQRNMFINNTAPRSTIVSGRRGGILRSDK